MQIFFAIAGRTQQRRTEAQSQTGFGRKRQDRPDKDDEHGRFKVQVPVTGKYLLFTAHDVPTHLYAAGDKFLKYVWDKTFRHEHSHDEEVTSVGISLPRVTSS